MLMPDWRERKEDEDSPELTEEQLAEFKRVHESKNQPFLRI